MSVTSILSYYNKDYKDFRALLNKEIRTPKLNQEQIPPLLAPSISRNYALVGTAFDYYLRFSIEKKFRKVISSRWVAEASIELLGNSVKSNSDLKKFKDLWVSYKEKLTESKTIYNEYLVKDAIDLIELSKTCFFLAKLDLFYRGAINSYDTLLTCVLVEDYDIEDLMGIIKVCDPNIFKPGYSIILNPTFGKASKMVGGGDADLIIDKRLIDIKVTKEVKILRPYFNQLICYYLLSLIGGVDGIEEMTIKEIGLYFARYNYLWSVKIKKLATEGQFIKLKEFLEQKLKKYR